MAQDKQLPQLDAATISNDADLILTTQSGVAKKITAGLVRGKLLGQENTWTQKNTFPAIICRVNTSTTQSLPGAGVSTKVNFDTVELDPFNIWNATDKRMVFNMPGLWEVSIELYCITVPNTFAVSSSIFKNGVYHRRLAEIPGNGNDVFLTGSVVLEVNGTTDYAEAHARNSSGSAINIGTFNGVTSFLTAKYLGSI